MGHHKKAKSVKTPSSSPPPQGPLHEHQNAARLQIMTPCAVVANINNISDRVLRSRRGVISVNRRLQGYVGRPPKRLFTTEIKRKLKQWLVRRRRYPYPTREEKRRLAFDTGLDYSQICNWFANWRRKLKNAATEQQLHQVDVPQSASYHEASSWGRRILRYNLVAARNAEKIPVSDEDELHDEDDVELTNFSGDVDTNDSDADETRYDSPVDVVGEAMRDHCYSQPPSLMDRNGNYQQPNENVPRHEVETANHSKWLASLHSFVPQQSSSCLNKLHLVPPTSSCYWADVARRSTLTSSTTSVETRRARDELDAAEALTSLARAAREIVISAQ